MTCPRSHHPWVSGLSQRSRTPSVKRLSSLLFTPGGAVLGLPLSPLALAEGVPREPQGGPKGACTKPATASTPPQTTSKQAHCSLFKCDTLVYCENNVSSAGILENEGKTANTHSLPNHPRLSTKTEPKPATALTCSLQSLQ